MRRDGAQAGVARMAGLHQFVGVQAALHHGLGIAAAAHGHAQLGGLGLGVGLENGIGADVDADLRGQGFHCGFVADECGLDEALGGGFDGAAQGYVGQRPDDRRGDGRQSLAALDEFVKDVVVGGMADQRVNGNGFSQGGKIAHAVYVSRPAREWAARPYASIVTAGTQTNLCRCHTLAWKSHLRETAVLRNDAAST